MIWPKRIEPRWIGFSEDDAKRLAAGAKIRAAKPLFQRIEHNAFRAVPSKLCFDVVISDSGIMVDRIAVLD